MKALIALTSEVMGILAAEVNEMTTRLQFLTLLPRAARAIQLEAMGCMRESG
jgi:hypothetical protein